MAQFNASPDAPRYRSTAFLELDSPAERLVGLIDEAHLHRGSLREQDGYTIPFREGGDIRITIVDAPAEGSPGLALRATAPTPERLQHVKDVMGQQIARRLQLDTIDWEDESTTLREEQEQKEHGEA